MPVARPLFLLTLLAVLAGALPALAVSPVFVAVSVDGGETTGELVDVQADKIVLRDEGQEIAVPTDSLLNLSANTPQQAAKPDAYVQMTDGSLLPLRELTVASHQATIDTPIAAAPITVATDDVSVVQFSSRAREDSAFWSDLTEGSMSEDMLVVQQSEKGQVEHLAGVLGDVSAEQVKFNWDGEDLPVKRTKVVALAYYHRKPPEWPAALCQLTTTDGAELAVAKIEWNEPGLALRVTTLGGLQVSVPLDRVVRADYSQGKLTYLSDLQPLKVEWTPRIDLPTAAELIRDYGLPRRDQSYGGSALTLTWPSKDSTAVATTKTYPKGLALRSRTVADYRIPAGMSRLVAAAGIDPDTASQGNVSLEITADDEVVWKGEIDGQAPPVEIDVPLPEARRLRIVVDYGGNLDYGDRLHLVDARMTK